MKRIIINGVIVQSSCVVCCSDAGFEITTLSYCNTWLFPVAALVRLVRKCLPSGTAGTELALPPAPINALLAMLFASERHLLSHMKLPFGISLLAVAKKLPG